MILGSLIYILKAIEFLILVFALSISSYFIYLLGIEFVVLGWYCGRLSAMDYCTKQIK